MFRNKLKSLAILIALLIPSAYVFTQVEHGNTPPPSGMDFLNERDVLKANPGSASAGVGFRNEDSASNDSLNDHMAKIFEFEGDVRVLKNGTGLWLPVQAWMVIREGDKLRTGPDSFINVVYDDLFLNVVRIDEKTIAEFKSIEPTDLYLSDGTVFSAVDGLRPGDQYQVSTPVAVAAVRGTHFDVTFQADTGWFSAATIPVPEDAHQSIIEVQQVLGDGSVGATVELAEGSQFDLDHGGFFGASSVREIAPERIDAAVRQFTAIKNTYKKYDTMPGVASIVIHSGDDQASAAAVAKRGQDDYAGQGPGNGGDGGDIDRPNDLTSMTVTPPSNLQAPGSSVIGAATAGFNKDQFVDRILEMEIAPPADDMRSLADYETNGFIPEGESDSLARNKAQPNMRQMMEFIDLSGTKTTDPENRDAALAVMHSVMTSMDVPEAKAEHVMESYDNYLDGREAMMNVDQTSLTTPSYDISEPVHGELIDDSFRTSTMDSSLETTFSQEFDPSYDTSLAVDSFADSYEGDGGFTGGVEYELDSAMVESQSYYEPEPEPEINVEPEMDDIIDASSGAEPDADTDGTDPGTIDSGLFSIGPCE